jgi:DNA-binding CsgD family transcriptional regulator
LEQEGNVINKAAVETIRLVLEAEWVAFFERDFDEFAQHWLHAPYVRRTLSGPATGTRTFLGWDTIAARVKEGMLRYPQPFNPKIYLRWDNLTIHTGSDMAWVTYDQVAIANSSGLQASKFQHETKILELTQDGWKLACLTIIVPDIEGEDVPQVELSADGRVQRVNSLATVRLSDHPGLVVSNQRLRARNRAFEAALQSAIDCMKKRLCSTNDPNVFLGNSVEHVSLGEDDFGRPVYCWITLEQERIIVSFDDAVLMSQRLELAGRVFALSPAQSRLVELLAAGHDLPHSAQQIGVSVNTLRTQLSRMFEKTGANSQTGLISTLLSVEPPR